MNLADITKTGIGGLILGGIAFAYLDDQAPLDAVNMINTMEVEYTRADYGYLFEGATKWICIDPKGDNDVTIEKGLIDETADASLSGADEYFAAIRFEQSAEIVGQIYRVQDEGWQAWRADFGTLDAVDNGYPYTIVINDNGEGALYDFSESDMDDKRYAAYEYSCSIQS